MRVGVVGLGLGKTHALTYDRREEVSSIALCDVDLDRAREFAEQLQTPAVCYAALDAMLAAEVPEAVSVVTPDAFHRQQAEAILALGAHVLLTKPIATNLEDAAAIEAAAAAAAGRLMIAHERRFRPSYARARELIAAGALGDIIYVRLQGLQNAAKKFARAPWYAGAEAGRTAITGSGVHQVDLMRWLSGKEVLSVRALGNRIGPIGFHHYKTIASLFELQDGAIGEVVFTYESTPPFGGDGLMAIGSEGMIADGRFRSRSGTEEILDFSGETMESGSAACVDAFLDALTAGAPMPVTAADAIRSLAAALAANRAAETDTVIRLSSRPQYG